MKQYIVLFLFFFLFQNAIASVLQEDENLSEQKVEKKVKLPWFSFVDDSDAFSYTTFTKEEKEISFYSPSQQGFRNALDTGDPFHFTGKSPQFPPSQDIVMEIGTFSTPNFLKDVKEVVYAASFFPSKEPRAKGLIGIALPTGGFDAHIASLTETLTTAGYHVVIPHSEASRFAIGGNQLKLSGLSCFWDILRSMQIVSSMIGIKNHGLYGVSRGATVIHYGLSLGAEEHFPELRLTSVVLTDFLPMVQVNDHDMSRPKTYHQAFFNGNADSLHNPENLRHYMKRLEKNMPRTFLDSLFPRFALQEYDADHYFATLTPGEAILTSYSDKSLVLADPLQSFNGARYFPLVKTLFGLKDNPEFALALKEKDVRTLSRFLSSEEDTTLTLKVLQVLPGDPVACLSEQHRMNLVFTFLTFGLKGFSLIGSGEYQGDGIHSIAPWDVLPNHFVGSGASFHRPKIEFKVNHGLRKQHIKDALEVFKKRVALPVTPPSSLRQSID